MYSNYYNQPDYHNYNPSHQQINPNYGNYNQQPIPYNMSNNNPMNQNYMHQHNPHLHFPHNYNNNDNRLIGGFLGPFLLGGLTGGLAAPLFYPRPIYPMYPPPMYHGQYRPYPPHTIFYK
ncbi:MAG: hypothetical protein ACK5HP_01355 [Bacilli bacterium]